MRSAAEAFEVLEEYVAQNFNTPRVVFEALHMLWEEIRASDVRDEPSFDDKAMCFTGSCEDPSRQVRNWNGVMRSNGGRRTEGSGRVITGAGADGREKEGVSVNAMIMAKVLEESWRREIESAIRNAKRSAEDKQWRRQWYRATARIAKTRRRHWRNGSHR